ncbi:hypothetical protein FOCC_FOCC013310 [Frankliniella occidentalis]|uniref:Transmembrane protein 19 n=1 Tax=Frankliniella occidentalis TaxID=133901 RepID=A0A6J1SQU3_FRAOC|nr:transmembrane protein 19 [Frankliniella occidentalis]KAE8741148.1 hypothetical protein FOCC_FOCC013310 [Frankliniella occidentalis]
MSSIAPHGTNLPQSKSKKSLRLQMFMPESLVPVFLFVVAIPISMLMWIGHLAFSFFKETSRLDSDLAVVPPTRWLASTLIPLVIVLHALRKKQVSTSGAALGSVIAFILSLASYSFLACLIAFFFSSSKATKFRQEKKKKLEEHFKEGGQRNWVQVLCNGGMAAQLSFLYILDLGCGERPINFVDDYRGSWLNLGVLGAFACCNGDTWASELGTVVGKADPYLITSWRKVPRGTNGGVTIGGLIFSAAGGALVGVFHYLATIIFIDSQQLVLSPPQWPLILAGALAGFFGSLLDSILGASLQYSGVDERTGIVVERSGKGVRHISGIRFLDNHCVNLISSITIGLLTPRLANIFWPTGY